MAIPDPIYMPYSNVIKNKNIVKPFMDQFDLELQKMIENGGNFKLNKRYSLYFPDNV